MKVIPSTIPEVFEIEPIVFQDDRGFFLESFNKEELSKIGIEYDFVQDNHSSSVQGTLRGLHYQISHVQGKLIRVVRGEIFDVAVDLRKHSPYFGKWVSSILTAENKKQLWIPPGFAHGFYTISPLAEVLYKTTDYYDPQGERCIRWDDPDINIDWPIKNKSLVLLSQKDQRGSCFIEAEVFN